MKCLSLWQPWATLMAIGAKRFETRSWKPPLERGCGMTLAIHAAKKWNKELSDLCATEPFMGALTATGRTEPLPFGAIVCVVEVAMWENTDFLVRTGMLTEQERAFGDYTPGRFAWLTTNLRRLPEPIPLRGAQGLFDVPDDLLAPVLQPAT